MLLSKILVGLHAAPSLEMTLSAHNAYQGTEAFCSGGDQTVRGRHGYVGDDNIGRLNILDVQVPSHRAS